LLKFEVLPVKLIQFIQIFR